MSRASSMDEIREICNLDDNDFSQRVAELRDQGLFSRIRTREKLVDGIALSFDITPENREALRDFVAFEQKCCSNLRFALPETPEALRLEIRGIDPNTDILGTHSGATTGRGAAFYSVARSAGLGSALAFSLCCLLPVGIVSVAGSSTAAYFARLDNPWIISAGAAVFGTLLWRRERDRAAKRATASDVGGCGC